jgi:hypothetical protein
MLKKTATAATILTLGEADFVGSATLIAFTVTVAGEGTLADATYSPLVEIVPHAAPTQAASATVQVTTEFEVRKSCSQEVLRPHADHCQRLREDP